ncbi:MAG: hypothetical protein ACPGWR_11615 [Ardenticatenaceae bacterium]
MRKIIVPLQKNGATTGYIFPACSDGRTRIPACSTSQMNKQGCVFYLF